MIIANNITKYYYTNRKKHILFENLSFQLESRHRFGLLGPNGAGKSTLLRILCGVEHPNYGTVKRTSTISWPVGLASGFISALTGEENIKFVCRLYACKALAQKEKIRFVQEFAELGDHFKMPVNTYSSGMMARLAFGMSMAFDFDFYVVDESFAVGDDAFRQKSLQVFNEKTKHSGLILVSHDINVIKEYCDQGIYLNQGRLLYSQSIDEIIGLYQGKSSVQ